MAGKNHQSGTPLVERLAHKYCLNKKKNTSRPCKQIKNTSMRLMEKTKLRQSWLDFLLTYTEWYLACRFYHHFNCFQRVRFASPSLPTYANSSSGTRGQRTPDIGRCDLGTIIKPEAAVVIFNDSGEGGAKVIVAVIGRELHVVVVQETMWLVDSWTAAGGSGVVAQQQTIVVSLWRHAEWWVFSVRCVAVPIFQVNAKLVSSVVCKVV